MFSRFFAFFKELDRRVKVIIAGIGVHNWGQHLSGQYNTLYARDLGADPVELGVLSSISTAFSSLIAVPMGWVAERYSIKKVLLLGFVCTFLSATIRAMAGNWWMLIPAILLTSMVRINPLADIIFINSTKPEQSGTVIGLSRTIWAIPSIIAPLLAAAIVTNYGGINAQGIRPLYYLQLGVTVFVFVFIALMLQTPSITTTPKTAKLASKGFIQDFRGFFAGERWLKRWVVLRIIRSIIFSISGPFWALWMVEVKGATAPILGVMGTVSAIISVFVPVFVGRLADQVGRKKAFYILRPITYLTVGLMILAPTPEFLILAQVFGGIGSASFIPFITMHWELVPQEKRGRWYGIEAFINIFSIPATILGGFLWQHGFMVEVLVLPSIIEALVAIPIFFTIPDTLSQSR